MKSKREKQSNAFKAHRKHLDPKTVLVCRCFLAFLYIDLTFLVRVHFVVPQIGKISIWYTISCSLRTNFIACRELRNGMMKKVVS